MFSSPTRFGVCSSVFDDFLMELLRPSLESDTSWLCLRARGGAGGVFLLIEEDGDGGSGVFPAASLSNIDSRSDSWLARLGAGGSGLLRSVWERRISNCERGSLLEYCCDVFETSVGGDCKVPVPISSLNSTLISFPCLELGGGGFFLPAIED